MEIEDLRPEEASFLNPQSSVLIPHFFFRNAKCSCFAKEIDDRHFFANFANISTYSFEDKMLITFAGKLCGLGS